MAAKRYPTYATVKSRFKRMRRKVRIVGVCLLSKCEQPTQGRKYYCEQHSEELRTARNRESVGRYYAKAGKGAYAPKFVADGMPTAHAVKCFKQTIRLLQSRALGLSENQDLNYRRALAEALDHD